MCVFDKHDAFPKQKRVVNANQYDAHVVYGVDWKILISFFDSDFVAQHMYGWNSHKIFDVMMNAACMISWI